MNEVWETKSGKKIRICDLSDSHIMNIIDLFENFIDDYYPNIYYSIREEAGRRRLYD